MFPLAPRRGLRLALVLSALAGCTDPRLATTFDACHPTDLVLPAGLPEGRVAAVARGVRLWSDALNLPWEAVTTPRADAISIPVRFIDTAWFYGRYDDVSPTVIFSTAVTDEQALGVVAAHEVGHALGLYHVERNVQVSVMNPGNLTVEPTRADLDEVVGLWGHCASDASRGMLSPP